MTRRRFATRRALHASSAGAPFLPLVGVFSNLSPVSISTLPNITYTGANTVYSTRTNPIKAKTITMAAAASLNSDPAGATSIVSYWIWCDTFDFGTGAGINVDGENGVDGIYTAGYLNHEGFGGRGGWGMAGAGGGASVDGQIDPALTALGGSGNDVGGDGPEGQGLGAESGGPGGHGTGDILTAGNPFSLNSGGASEDDYFPAGPFGGSGGGGNATNDFAPDGDGAGGGGGGSGGGLGLIVCNHAINGAGSFFSSIGGSPGNGAGIATRGYAGGGGVIALFTKTYSGLYTYTVDGGPLAASGNATIYRFDNTLTIINSNAPWNIAF